MTVLREDEEEARRRQGRPRPAGEHWDGLPCPEEARRRRDAPWPANTGAGFRVGSLGA